MDIGSELIAIAVLVWLVTLKTIVRQVKVKSTITIYLNFSFNNMVCFSLHQILTTVHPTRVKMVELVLMELIAITVLVWLVTLETTVRQVRSETFFIIYLFSFLIQ